MAVSLLPVIEMQGSFVDTCSRVVEDRQPDHTHDGNMSASLARKAVGEMKKVMIDTTLAPSAVRGRNMTNLDDGVLLALPSRAVMSRTLQREKHRVAKAAGVEPLPAIPTDLSFDMPTQFADMVLYDSGSTARLV